MGMKCDLPVVLICFSLVTDVVEHVFMDLLAICVSALDSVYS